MKGKETDKGVEWDVDGVLEWEMSRQDQERVIQ